MSFLELRNPNHVEVLDGIWISYQKKTPIKTEDI